MRFFFSVVLTFSSLLSFTQCLTDFSKLVPEPTVDAVVGFGNAVSMYDNYLAVGIPFHDSLGRATGIVEIYELVNNAWEKKATMAPSDPADGIRFGLTVKLTQDYLLVGAQRNGGKVYLFKKDALGWTSSTERTTFSSPATSYYGIHSNRSLSVSDDQQTIAIADPYYHDATMPLSRSGAIYVYHKSASDEWSGGISPTILLSPEDDCRDFGTSGASMLGNRLVTATPYAPNGVGRVYVYTDSSPGFQQVTLEAKLDPGLPDPFDTYLFSGVSIAQTPEGIFVTGTTGLQTDALFGIIYFEKPASGTWINTALPTCYIEPKNNDSTDNRHPFSISSNGSDIFASVRDQNGYGYLHVIRKGVSGWCSPSFEMIDSSGPPMPPLSTSYGQVYAVNQAATTATIGFVPHPESPNSMIALKVLNKNGGAWESQLIYSTKKSTAGHFYGGDVMGFDDYLFVGAPNDGSVKPNAGAVYTYKKVGNDWQKTGKILPPLGQSPYDDVFGSALATNKTYLAVGATGHEPKGKIFMYKKTSPDWSSVELVQEVTIPEEGLTVYAYGDNVAMDDNWLVIPYAQNAPISVILAIFKFNGSTWDFKQTADVGFPNFFTKELTIDVAIENGVIVAGDKILELNVHDAWEIKYTLSPSDPEHIRISSDFTHWISNGALFGHSVALHDNTIFIGAPLRDYNGTWDVGAVYVYTKRPNEPWSSRTESKKLVPRIKDENELFGYSLNALHNTLIVGAPGNDYYKNNTARNKPGRAYVFQAEDYFWQNVTPLIDFTGESFEKDYYGISVYLDETDFFMGASIEDIESAKLSGAVYVTPTPPIVKLAPPVCQSNNNLVDLFGYPFGGIWSGPGMVDVIEGTFDPMVLEPGEHTFTYITPGCSYPGKLKINVDPPVHAILQTDTSVFVCTGKSFSKTLQVQPQNGCQYQWYFKNPSSTSFTLIPDAVNPSWSATQRGQYQVKVYNASCNELSPIITINDEIIDLQLTPLGPVCNNISEGIELVAVPSGGVWTGSGVINNTVVPKNLLVGMNRLNYAYTSTHGCNFQEAMDVQVAQSFIPTIAYLSGDLCRNGTVSLGVLGAPVDATFTWLEQDADNNYTILAGNASLLTINHNGSFKVKGTHDVCEAFSEPFILDAKLVLEMKPAANEFEVCSDDLVKFSFQDEPGTTYGWYFTEETGEALLQLPTTEHFLTALKTGYYTAVVTRGVCVFESDPKYVLTHPRDTLFIPNVFTPNGDGLNDVFQVISNQNIVSLAIYNRYGQTVFQGDGQSPWDGTNTASGVYYWLVTYVTCQKQRRTDKGWVHLVR